MTNFSSGAMKFNIKGNLAEFVNGCDTRETLSKDCNELSYGELKTLWKQHKDSQNRFSCIYELLQGCDIKWDNLYHQKKVKSPEELKAYKARLQELEYRQLTKSMEKQKTDYFKGSHKKEISAVVNCFVTVIGMFIAFYAMTSSIGCQPVTCICSGLSAALCIAFVELYYLLRTL